MTLKEIDEELKCRFVAIETMRSIEQKIHMATEIVEWSRKQTGTLASYKIAFEQLKQQLETLDKL